MRVRLTQLTRLSTYVTVDDIPYAPPVERWAYPRAGDSNPIAKLGIVRLIEVRVRQNDGVDAPRIDRERPPVALNSFIPWKSPQSMRTR